MFSFDDFGSGDGLETHCHHLRLLEYAWECRALPVVLRPRHDCSLVDLTGYQIWLQEFEVMFVHEKPHPTGYPLLHRCDTEP